ncbi:hypothetical protein Cch01nite_27630 [Cellulomonas chitinilytica]|uniref:Uncharacterized protein n=1 Tax=Cellulomonas chitinilytica TaxID=398759 RepID=A0A919P635_9CELL|nr:hypothetical protein Cch01nite_27630 [Cellulomonas chitinilytica]
MTADTGEPLVELVPDGHAPDDHAVDVGDEERGGHPARGQTDAVALAVQVGQVAGPVVATPAEQEVEPLPGELVVRLPRLRFVVGGQRAQQESVRHRSQARRRVVPAMTGFRVATSSTVTTGQSELSNLP